MLTLITVLASLELELIFLCSPKNIYIYKHINRKVENKTSNGIKQAKHLQSNFVPFEFFFIPKNVLREIL